MRKVITPYLLLLLLFIISVEISFGQSAGIQWQKKIGGTKDDIATDVIVNKDGTMLIAGYSYSNDRDISGHHGSLDSADALIAKFDVNGNLLWQKTLGGNGDDKFVTIIPSGDGNYICIGSTNSKDGDIPFNNGNYDFLLVKIDPAGNVIWVKTYGGSYNELASNGILTSDSLYVVVGTSSSYDGDVQSKTFGNGSPVPWLVKIDRNGNILWENTAYSPLGAGNDVLETDDGNYEISGTNSLTYITVIYDNSPFGEPVYGYFPSTSGKAVSVDKNNGSMKGTLDSIVDFGYGSGEVGGCTAYGYCGAWPDTLCYQFPYSSDFHLCKKPHGFFTSSSIYCYYQGYLNTIANGLAKNNPWNLEYPMDNIAPLHSSVALTDSTFVIVGTDQGIPQFILLDIRAQSFSTFNPIPGNYSGSIFNSVKILPSRNEFIVVGGYKTAQSGMDCWITRVSNLNKITGNVFLDQNNNGIWDPGESSFDNAKIQSTKNGVSQYAIPSYGRFTNLVDTGTYTTTITISDSLYATTNGGKQTTFTAFGSSDTVNFPVHLVPQPIIRDYAVSVIPIESARPNLDVEYVINYSNKGTDTLINRSITFVKDRRSIFGYGTPLPSIITGDTLQWVIDSLLPNNSGAIKFYIQLDPIPQLNINDTVFSKVYIDSTGDKFPLNNTAILRQLVVGSFDPNDKQESHGGFITPDEWIKDSSLLYTIHFQNKGNEEVNTIIIRDTLDKQLNGSTIEMSSCSHPYQFSIQNGRYLTWTFDEINLPDSVTNDSLSRGYICYKVKPVGGLVTGDTIRNSASIYFDYNPPIATNTQVTVFTAEKDTWTGAKNTAWEDPLNWSKGKVPDAGVDVYINNGMTNYPVVNSNASCRSIYVNPGATITVNTNYKINVGGIYLP